MNLLNSLQPVEATEGSIDNYTSICCDFIIDWRLFSNGAFIFLIGSQSGKLPPLPRSDSNGNVSWFFIYVLKTFIKILLTAM